MYILNIYIDENPAWSFYRSKNHQSPNVTRWTFDSGKVNDLVRRKSSSTINLHSPFHNHCSSQLVHNWKRFSQKRELRGIPKKHGNILRNRKEKKRNVYIVAISTKLVQYLWVLRPTETQSSSALPWLLHVLYDRARLGVGDALLHDPKRLPLPLLGLLDQSVAHVQCSATGEISSFHRKTVKSQNRVVWDDKLKLKKNDNNIIMIILFLY